MSIENMKIWGEVCETDPAITKRVSQRGGFTAICAQAQLKSATVLWGPYGTDWGVKETRYSYIGPQEQIQEIVLDAVFYYPGGAFPISSDMPFKVGNDSRKKLLTDVTTKALSKLGFNSDVFEGKFDDNKYVEQMSNQYTKREFSFTKEDLDKLLAELPLCRNLDHLNAVKARATAEKKNMTPNHANKLRKEFAARELELTNESLDEEAERKMQ